MKIGDLVEFTYYRLGGQIDGIGLVASTINKDAVEILYMEKVYQVHKQFVKPIAMQRKDSLNEIKDN